MAVTKTNFINYIRCPRYVALDEIKKEKLDADVSINDYKEEEREAMLIELLGTMYQEDEETGEIEDLIDVENKQLKIMMPYYNRIELLAGKHCTKFFGGESKYSEATYDQESFDFLSNGIRYLCYVDIYNENDAGKNIIEVKATTSKKYLEIDVVKKRGKEKFPMFFKDNDGIFQMLEFNRGIDLSDETFLNNYIDKKNKLSNRFDKCGKYIYDLAVQRYILENDLKQYGKEKEIKEYRFYLAVLNHEYVFDGTLDENGIEVYNIDENGNDIIVLFDFTNLTKEMMPQIEKDKNIIEKYILEKNMAEYPLGDYCQRKDIAGCKFVKTCFKRIPKYNSVFTYIDNHHKFTPDLTRPKEKIAPFDLINDGVVNMLDIPESWLTRRKNITQRRAVESGKEHINKEKIKVAIDKLSYPIYHLDFETFPCPLPRFKGEKCYTQSPFQFSLHIESSPGVCDKETNHLEFLATDLTDKREELVKALCEYIDMGNGGTLFAQNVGFEKSRIKELSICFPEYGSKLRRMIDEDVVFDLLYIVKGGKDRFLDWGFEQEEAEDLNYYHNDLQGSYSIKKVLPLFSSLSYNDLDVKNGTEALVTYAQFNDMKAKEKEEKIQALKYYCCQDTWAMVEILDSLRKKVN